MPKPPSDTHADATPARGAGHRIGPRVISITIAACFALALLAWMMGRTVNDRRLPTTPHSAPSPPSASDPITTPPSPVANTEILNTVSSHDPVLPDPAKDGWNSEALHEATNRQLKQLAKLLAKIHADTEPRDFDASLGKIVAPSFGCGPLHPARLDQIFDDDLFVIHRAAAAADTSSHSPTHQGVEGFATAVTALLKPLRNAASIRVGLKQFRIDTSGATPTTVVHFEASGATPVDARQINATWRCRWARGTGGEPPQLSGLVVDDYEQSAIAGLGRTLFTDCTDAVFAGDTAWREQLRHGVAEWLARFEFQLGVTYDGHHGLAVGDVNGDGLDDVYLCQPGGLPNLLLVQNPDGTVTNCAADGGVDILDETRAALIVDFDNDGAQDLVAASLRKLLVFAGDGKGNFSLKAELDGLFQHSLAASDYDSDGDLDLFVCNYSPDHDPDGNRFGRPIPFHNATNGGPNLLLRLDGNWQFTDVIDTVGMGPTNNRWSYAAAWEDYDNDGDLDLYVANDFGHNNLYRNDGGHFEDVAEAAGAVDANFGMSVTWSDINHDGRMDLYVSNMFSAAGNRITTQPGFREAVDTDDMSVFHRMARGNSFLESTGASSFRDSSDTAGTTMGRWSWGSLFADLNNDGHDDLLVTNGFLTQDLEDDL